MFSVLSHTNGVWNQWTNAVVHKRELALKSAALVTIENAKICASSNKLHLSEKEILLLKQSFQQDAEKITIENKTYIIKSKQANQLIAFNGNKYVIVCQTKTMFLIALCTSRARHEEAAKWLSWLTGELTKKDF